MDGSMKKIGRNDPCPCGSGKKFKKCHLGREAELFFADLDRFPAEQSARITSLSQVSYGRSREILSSLDIEGLTGARMGIKFIDLDQYHGLGLPEEDSPDSPRSGPGSVVVNLHKTRPSDPDNFYIAISPDVTDAILIHQISHVLDFLAGSGIIPGTVKALSYELDVPVEHLEHPREFGYWLDFMKREFRITPDADDAIILYLYEHEMLIPGHDILRQDTATIKMKSSQILRFLHENREEIDELIRELPGYIGPRP